MNNDGRGDASFVGPGETPSAQQSYLATALPDAGSRRVALVVIVLSAISLCAMAPFATTHLARLPAFIPSYEAALTIIDLVTSVLLLSQFTILRRRSLLAVACAYFVSSILVAAHALSFPGAFHAAGLFGDAQTTAWLYVLWHASFPILIGVYALLAGSSHDKLPASASTARIAMFGFTVAFGVAIVFVMLASAGAAVLPVMIVDGDYHFLVSKGVTPGIIAVCLAVIGVMWRSRHRSVMDVWLFAVLWVWMCDVALSAIVSSARYDLGWYGGRVFGLLAASFVLAALLFELDKLYARLASAVSEAEARNEELVRSRDVLVRVQRFEALGQLTGGIAHDFNNLLTAITGGLEMISRRPGDQARVVRLAANAAKAADRGTQLIRRLMSFARKQSLRPEVLATNETLREFGALAASLPASQVTLRFELEEVGTICVDEAEFQAAFLNLVGNARDAMPNGGEVVVATRQVSLSAADLVDTDAKPGVYVQIAITDHGVGMDTEMQSRIFEPFFTTKPHGVGTGLGMSQVYGFVRSAQGQLVVESAVGRGTTIRINLPRSETSHIERQQVAQAREHAPVDGISILLVEDDGDVLLATKDRVEELGYLVVTATSGDEAFALLSQGLEVDIVFSDIVMPGKLNGVQLAEAIRRIRPGLKLVLTSGYTGGTLDQFHLPKGLLFLPKPYSQKDLADKLGAAHAS